MHGCVLSPNATESWVATASLIKVLRNFSLQPILQPPDCFAPAMAGLDERDDWSCSGGAHWWHLGLGWGLQLAALQAKRRGDDQAWYNIRRSLEDGTYLREGPGTC